MMESILLVAVIGLALIVAFAMRSARRKQKREALRAAPFPGEWESILKRNLPYFPKLPDGLKDQLRAYIKLFIGEKLFEGCGGLEVDDEMKVTIAGQACVLLLNRDEACYPKLKAVLVYPSKYKAGGKGIFGGQHDDKSTRLGESWGSGTVVLAWDSVEHGARNFKDGHNVTMHEFAHQLDQEDGAADGAPILDERSAYSTWASVFSDAYARHVSMVNRGRKSVMDAYGATNPAEFFAVATETFFEKPKQLKRKHPALFEELKGFYQVDPLKWI